MPAMRPVGTVARTGCRYSGRSTGCS
jgi:hypothetical protein